MAKTNENSNDTPCYNNFTKETYQNAVMTEAELDRCTGCNSFTYNCGTGIAGCKKFDLSE